MSWKENYREKVISAEEAVRLIKPGDYVRFPMAATPLTLISALARRRGQLKDVYIAQPGPQPAPGVGWWDEPGWDDSFHVSTEWPDALCRPGIEMKTVEFRPVEYTLARTLREEGSRPDTWTPDFFMCPVSPPNEQGYCNLGQWVWHSDTYARAARTLIVEVDESWPWCYGDTMLSVSEIDYMVEKVVEAPPPVLRRITDDMLDDKVKTIGQYVAELVPDGSTIQMGVGVVSMAAAHYLFDKHDLGIHSELVTEPMMDLWQAGVITCKRKNVNTGKAVATCLSSMDPNYVAMVNKNPFFEFRSVEYTNDIRVISSHDNMVAINTTLAIDLSGQVASETMGPRFYSASGGQISFMMGSMLSRGGRTIIALPSTARKGTISRIVPILEAGTVVTVPRSWVDFIVTEHGLVNLQGKTLRQRAEALISIAHPDFRAELRREAQKLF